MSTVGVLPWTVADNLPQAVGAPIALADPVTHSVHDAPYMMRVRDASRDATAQCAKEGKVAVASWWPEGTYQLGVTFRCMSEEDPRYKAIHKIGNLLRLVALDQAQNVCAAQGKEAQAIDLNELTFYECISPFVPPEWRKPGP